MLVGDDRRPKQYDRVRQTTHDLTALTALATMLGVQSNGCEEKDADVK